MDLRQIRFVIAVARHGAVRRAAAMLNVDQAIVSGKTRDLEAELGVKLFERHSGGVRLTGPGATFVDGATRALKALDDTASHVRSVGHGQAGALSLGYVWSIAAGPAQSLLVHQQARAPGVEVTLHEQGAAELSSGLMDRSLDLALLIGGAIPDVLERHELWKEHLYFAVIDTCSVSDEAEWGLLASNPLLVSAREDWTFYQRIADQSGGPKFDPRVHDCSRDGVLGMVAAGAGIAIAPQSTASIPFPGVRFVPIAGPATECSVYAAWLKANGNPALKHFIALLKRHYPSRPRQSAPV